MWLICLFRSNRQEIGAINNKTQKCKFQIYGNLVRISNVFKHGAAQLTCSIYLLICQLYGISVTSIYTLYMKTILCQWTVDYKTTYFNDKQQHILQHGNFISFRI